MCLALCSVTDNRAMPTTYFPIEFSPQIYGVDCQDSQQFIIPVAYHPPCPWTGSSGPCSIPSKLTEQPAAKRGRAQRLTSAIQSSSLEIGIHHFCSQFIVPNQSAGTTQPQWGRAGSTILWCVQQWQKQKLFGDSANHYYGKLVSLFYIQGNRL